MKRDTTIDGLRGIAIILMYGANMWPYCFPNHTPPVPLRVLFSVVAPLFIFLSGYTAGMRSDGSLSAYQLYRRAAKILMMAVLIDVAVWHVLPFHTFDVLYVIATGQLLFAARAQLGTSVLWLATAASIGLYLAPHTYNFELFELPLTDLHSASAEPLRMLQSMIWDGWFPLAPWLAWMMASYFVAKSDKKSFPLVVLAIIGMFSIVSYLFSISINSSLINQIRNGYAELFYPVTLYFIVFMIGVGCLALTIIRGTYALPAAAVRMGRYSLFAYLLHCTVIKLAIIPYTSFAQFVPTELYLTVWLASVVATVPLARWIQSVLDKSTFNKVRRPVLVLLGLS